MNCPNCGGPVRFLWSQSVQTTCPYCTSILVRTDVDLQKVGQVASFPQDPSPIQIGTEGIIDNKGFVVIGRICYEYEDGGWNEWHWVDNTGLNGWLSDAQLQYAVSRQRDWHPSLNVQMDPGTVVSLDGVQYTVTTITYAHYRAVEGELPFQFWDKENCNFVDLRGPKGEFLTVDFSEQTPLLYQGRSVKFDELKLKNLRPIEGW